MTVEHDSQPDLFGNIPDMPETAEQAIARAVQGGRDRQTTIDTTPRRSEAWDDLGSREGSGTAYDNRPLLEGDASESVSTDARPKRKRQDPPLSGKDQERFIVRAQGPSTPEDKKVTSQWMPTARKMGTTGLKTSITLDPTLSATEKRAMLVSRGIDPDAES